ncbi:MAG: porin family protein, partial [Bacteroidia bacterium]
MAQSENLDYRERLTFGLKVGANYANVYDEQTENFQADPKFGLAAGAFVSIPIGKYFGLQPEALFSQKGFKSSGSILGNTYNISRTSNYIDFPLLFAVTPSEFFTILAGPQYSYLISQKNTFANGSTTIEQEKAFDNENIRKNTLCFTGGVDLNMAHSVLSVRVGWDLRDNIGDGTSTTLRYKNMWYQ